MKGFIMLVLALAYGAGLAAQPMKAVPSKIKKGWVYKYAPKNRAAQKNKQLVQLVKKASALQHKTFRSPEALNLTLDRTLADFKLPLFGFSALLQANEARIEASKKLFKERLAWYRRERPQLLASLDRKPPVHKVDYTTLVDPSARIIFLGERHYVGNIRRQIAQTVLAYRKAYPHKKVYLLTEFLEMNYPYEADRHLYRNVLFEGKKIFWQYAPLFVRLQQSGVSVHGLEPLQGLREIARSLNLPDPNFTRGSLSLVGQAIRNQSWAHTIRRFAQQNPDAVIFVYTGFSHSSYKYLENLPSMLREFPSQMFLFDLAGEDTLNPALRDLFDEAFLEDSKALSVTVLKEPKYRRLLGADVLVYVHE